MNYRLILPMLFAVSAQAEIYKWTDNAGRNHYGSRPGAKQAESIKLEGSSIQSPTLSPKVVLYATSWCGYCAKARAHFKANHIAYDEQDIEANPTAKRAYDRLGGHGVPLILVDNIPVQGFNAEVFDSVYRQHLDANPH